MTRSWPTSPCLKNIKDPDYVNAHNVVLCTKKGVVKKDLPRGLFSSKRTNGINAITIREGRRVAPSQADRRKQ